MPGQIVKLAQALPRSHYFLTVSRGSGMRTLAVRSCIVHLAVVVLPLLLVAGLGSGLYVAFHDDLVAGLMARQGALQYAYEDRLENLRKELELETERGRTQQAKVDDRVRDLVAREAKLETRAAVVANLAGQDETGSTRGPAARSLPPQITGRPVALPTGALGFAAPDKPHPLSEPAASDAVAAHPGDSASMLDDPGLSLNDRMTGTELALDRVEREQAGTLSSLGGAARGRSSQLRSLLEEAGLSPDRYLTKPEGPSGGPFIPLPDGPDGQFGRAVAAIRGDLASTAQLRTALTRVPLAMPLSGRIEVTSPFGPRIDPFLGRPALHSGVDLHEGYGTEIRATAMGRVAFAGVAGGYGNMVEIDHGNGVATRYAHMGQIAVSQGETVARGTVVGYVGATGRATGPHLHYEVRIDGEPVDPMRFLQLAKRAGTAALIAGR